MKIVIRKRVDLEFLGKEYEKSYFIFRAISLPEYEKYRADLKAVKDDKAVYFLLDTLKAYFIEGKFPNAEGELEAVEADDLAQLDPDTIVKVFDFYTGQKQPPKV